MPWEHLAGEAAGTGCAAPHTWPHSLARVTVQDLDPLATLPKLTHLSLAGNPVATKPEYRCTERLLRGGCRWDWG